MGRAIGLHCPLRSVRIAVQRKLPSRTAFGAAAHRAAHQTWEGGGIYNDPLVCTIPGKEAPAIIEEAASDPSQRPMRLFIAARSRFAEDCLSASTIRASFEIPTTRLRGR